MAATGRDAPAQSATADRQIVISRVISAPRELVCEAFTEVRHWSRAIDRDSAGNYGTRGAIRSRVII
jgi:hypothetical protein